MLRSISEGLRGEEKKGKGLSEKRQGSPTAFSVKAEALEDVYLYLLILGLQLTWDKEALLYRERYLRAWKNPKAACNTFSLN